MIIDTLIQKIEEKVKQIDGTYITKHRQTSADIVLFDTNETDDNGNTIYSEVQSEIESIKEKNMKDDEKIEDIEIKQRTMSDLFHGITKVSNAVNKTSTSEIPTSYAVNKLLEESIKNIPIGGAGGEGGSSIDIPIILTSNDWTGEAAPYTQSLTVPQMREGMTPLYFFSGTGDDAQYAYNLILGYEAGYGQMTWRAADLPQVDIPITLKGIPAQQLEYADNTVVVVVPADGFELNEDLGRYEQTIMVEGMAAGANGGWDIVRSGEVLTEAESKIALSITDVIPLDGAIKIVCLWEPGQQYMLKLTGTYTQATEGTMLLAGMQGWFDRVGKLEDNLGDKFSADKDYAVGDYCIYEDVLYKFVADKEAGEWDRTKAEPTKVTAELGTLNAKMQGAILWENPNPSTNFVAQDVTLSSDDYNMYEIFYTARSGDSSRSLMSVRSIKGYGTELNTIFITNSAVMQRAVTYISDTSLRFENAYYGTSAVNSHIKPIKIIGYKS